MECTRKIRSDNVIRLDDYRTAAPKPDRRPLSQWTFVPGTVSECSVNHRPELKRQSFWASWLEGTATLAVAAVAITICIQLLLA